MSNLNQEYEKIPQEKFQFVQMDANLHDKKLETKSRGYFADAMLRFKKNKSSVVAAWIIIFLLLFSVVSPIISPYKITDKDKMYVSYPPFLESVAEKGWGFLDGGYELKSQNETAYQLWRAIGQETGMDPILRILGTTETVVKYRGKDKINYTYNLEVNKYYMTGILYRVFSYKEFENIQKWQNETGIQVIYPYVNPADICDLTDAPNLWFKISSSKGEPVFDKDGNFIPVYCTDQALAGAEYNSLRIPGDDGSYIYSCAKSGSVQCRICYYNYYTYVNGHAPEFLFGTNSMGQDIFSGIGIGARFSIIFAILVSAINLTIGAIYGAIQGYYGGAIDLVMDRITDVLAGIPFTVTVVLFQLHVAPKYGVVPTFLFAYILTGWIGMSALTRKQFYRFKGQEFVLAARTLGASDWRLMFKHIFPNSLGTIVTSCALVIPSVILTETNMTYLGIINLSDFAGTSIGTLMSQGQAQMTSAPHAMFWPALFISLLLISFNLFGNGLRDAFNPSTRGVED